MHRPRRVAVVLAAEVVVEHRVAQRAAAGGRVVDGAQPPLPVAAPGRGVQGVVDRQPELVVAGAVQGHPGALDRGLRRDQVVRAGGELQRQRLRVARPAGHRQRPAAGGQGHVAGVGGLGGAVQPGGEVAVDRLDVLVLPFAAPVAGEPQPQLVPPGQREPPGQGEAVAVGQRRQVLDQRARELAADLEVAPGRALDVQHLRIGGGAGRQLVLHAVRALPLVQHQRQQHPFGEQQLAVPEQFRVAAGEQPRVQQEVELPGRAQGLVESQRQVQRWPGGGVRAAQPQPGVLGGAAPGVGQRAGQLDAVGHRDRAAHPRPYPLDVEVQVLVLEPRDDPDVPVHPARRGVLGAARAGRPDPLAAQPAAAGQQHRGPPAALAPLPPVPQPARVEPGGEARPVVGPQRLPGLGGGVRPADGPGRQQQRPASAGLAEQYRLRRARPAFRAQVPGPGPAAEVQQAVAPGGGVQPGLHGELGADPDHVRRDGRALAQEGVVGAAAEQPADRDRGAELLLVGEQVEQFVQASGGGQVELQPGGLRAGPQRGRAHPPQQRADLLQVGAAELGVGPPQHLDEQVQFLVDDVVLVQPQVLPGLCSRASGEELPDQADGGDPVAQPLAVVAPLGDGRGSALPFAPVVDGGAEHVHAGGGEVRGDGHRRVLVEDALGVAEPVLVPEGAPVDLVPGGAVGDQVRDLGDVGAQHGPGEGLAVDRRRHPADRAEPGHVPGGEVGSGLVQGVDQQPVGVGRQRVVAVDEGQVLAPGGDPQQARVACRAEPLVGLPVQAEAGVAGGEGVGDLRAAVGGPVVDQDHVEVLEGLFPDRVQALAQVGLDVVDGDDDGESGFHGRLRAFLAVGFPAGSWLS